MQLLNVEFTCKQYERLLQRTFFHLPYLRARMTLARPAPGQVRYAAHRTHAGAPAAHFAATWAVGELFPAAEAAPGSLAFFLTERYCLYAAWGPTSTADASTTSPSRCAGPNYWNLPRI